MIGVTYDVVLLLVIFVDRSEADAETVPIISARKAEKYELRTYSAHLKY